ncbi:hypothetical protein AD006_29495 (plasmid) [Pseudonocardia sp. EC080610-09]|nr:hypothetical protein AD006_29495 [Pseudonocardia sp. EC080610-09]ALL85639.1 hypothetical protein AD017_31755 [Pseudonocardia sp. EC080619-01]
MHEKQICMVFRDDTATSVEIETTGRGSAVAAPMYRFPDGVDLVDGRGRPGCLASSTAMCIPSPQTERPLFRCDY